MSAELEAAIAFLESLAARRGRPTRHDARPILLGIGERLLEGDTAAADAASTRVGAAAAELREAFEEAVRDELGMAATEYVRSVDPRFLDLPAYDLAYTLETRRLLEARLRASERLGVPIEASLAAGIRRADDRLRAQPRARDRFPSDPGRIERMR